jgi:hypothetical protein
VPAFILFGYYFAIMKIYALFTLHEVRFPPSPIPYLAVIALQTGWGTRAGIGDASAATAAVDAENEKAAITSANPLNPNNSNNPYRQRPPQIQMPQAQQYQKPYLPRGPAKDGTPSTGVFSPFADPALTPFSDKDRDTPTPNTPAYTGRQGQGPGQSVSMRRRGEHEEEVEMEVGYAR